MDSSIGVRYMLLNFTKKRWDKSFFPEKINHQLMFDPFCRVVSRIEYKPDLFYFDLNAEFIPDLIKDNSDLLTWEECCHQRALELLALNKDEYIMSWSGGIDSTTALIAIVKTWPSEALKKVKVFLSHASILENPNFFDKTVSRFSLLSSMQDVSYKLKERNAILITGELGDQLFGSDILGPGVEKFGDDVLRKDYKEYAHQIIDLWIRREGPGKQIFERFHPMVTEAPFPIKSTFDFFWWMNFSQKWQHVKYRFVEQSGWNLDAKYNQQIIHFFDTVNFQKWSLNNHDLKIGNNWASYKLEAKKFIVQFTGNALDMNQKKIPSLALRNFLVQKRIAVTSDLQEVKTDMELERYVRTSN